jgi:protein-tyrosine phosphatase
MMMPAIYWVRDIEPLRFGIMARPRATDWLEDEVVGWKSAGVSRVVSLLQPCEVSELGLNAEASLCAAHGIKFEVLPIADRGTPNHPAAFLNVAAELASDVRSGSAVAVHCRAGIGRSALLGACVLSHLGVAREGAFAMLTRARGVTVPDTPGQVEWFKNFCSAHK